MSSFWHVRWLFKQPRVCGCISRGWLCKKYCYFYQWFGLCGHQSGIAPHRAPAGPSIPSFVCKLFAKESPCILLLMPTRNPFWLCLSAQFIDIFKALSSIFLVPQVFTSQSTWLVPDPYSQAQLAIDPGHSAMYLGEEKREKVPILWIQNLAMPSPPLPPPGWSIPLLHWLPSAMSRHYRLCTQWSQAPQLPWGVNIINPIL